MHQTHEQVQSEKDNFFELGGHSLLVSRIVSELRMAEAFKHVSAKDLYTNATFEDFTRCLVAHTTNDRSTGNTAGLVEDTMEGSMIGAAGPGQMLFNDILQLLAIVLLASTAAAHAFGALLLLAYLPLPDGDAFTAVQTGHIFGWITAFSGGLMIYSIMFAIAVKWVVIGTYKEGSHSLWSFYYTRWWFVRQVFRAATPGLKMLRGTPFLPMCYRMLGMRVGANVYMGEIIEPDGFDLVDIGQGVTLNIESKVKGCAINSAFLTLRRVTIKEGATIGVRAVVQAGVTMEEESQLGNMTNARKNQHIRRTEIWLGSPSTLATSSKVIRNAHIYQKEPRQQLEVASRTRCLDHAQTLLMGLCQLAGIIVVFMVQACPTMLLYTGFLYASVYTASSTHAVPPQIDDEPARCSLIAPNGTALGCGEIPQLGGFSLFDVTFWHMVAIGMAAGIAWPLLYTSVLMVLRPLLLINMRGHDQIFSLRSAKFFRRWFLDLLMEEAHKFTRPWQGTMFLPLWMWLMGGKIGTHVEISSTHNVIPETLELGDGAFIADSVVAGATFVNNGMVHLGNVFLGKRSFVGNGSMIPIGSRIPKGMLVGLQSVAPPHGYEESTWLGSPSISLTARQGDPHDTPDALTYSPSFPRVVARGLIELLGYIYLVFVTSVAMAAIVTLFFLGYRRAVASQYSEDKVTAILIFGVIPAVALAHGLFTCLITLVTKWVVIGRFRKGRFPLWSLFVWRTELVERVEENLSEPFVKVLGGTVWIGWWIRLLGAKVGRRPYICSDAVLTETDLISIGNRCTLEQGSTLQAHLFQDRIRDCDTVSLGNSCSIGTNSVVLAGGEMGEGSSISALSLIMRGESLPPYTHYIGIPVQRSMPKCAIATV